jgi:hypothetical protein
MGDRVQDNLQRGGMRPLNRIELSVAVQENVQFWRLGDAAAMRRDAAIGRGPFSE